MTEKRFTLGKDYSCDGNWEYCYQDNETGRRFNFADDNCDTDFLELVNAVIDDLKKENKELKEERKGFESCSHNWGILYDEAKNKVEELSKENIELRKENYGNLDGLNYYQEQNGHLSSKISDLECENEQLKQQLGDIDSLIYDLWHEEMQRQYEEITDDRKTI